MTQTTGSDVAAPPGRAGAAGRGRWFGLAALATAQLMVVLDATIVNVALPSLTNAMNIAPGDRQWVITAYTLPFAGLLLLAGRVADYTGRKRALLIGLTGFAVASAIGGVVSSFGLLLAARAAQGAFGALLAPSVLSLLSTTFTDPRERGKAFAVFGAVVGSGSAVGLVLGGVLTTYLSWHWVFFVNVPIAILAGLGVTAFIQGSRNPGDTRYDIPGTLLASAGLVALVYGFTTAVDNGWTAPLTLGMLAVGVALLLGFVLVESRVREPLLPLSIPRHRGRGGAYLAVLLAFAGMFGMFLFVSFYLQGIEGFSAVSTGLAFLPMALGTVLSSTVASRLMSRVPPRLLMGPGLLLAAAGMGLLTQLDITGSYLADVLPSLVMVGVGMGFVFPVAANLATAGVRPEESGAASATLNVSQQVGGSLGTALLNTIAASTTAAYIASHVMGPKTKLIGLVEGYNTATGWAAGILAVAGVIALLLIDTRLDTTTESEPTAAD